MATPPNSSSFSSMKTYVQSLSQTPTRLSQRAFSTTTTFDETSRVRSLSGSDMRKTLRWFDLICFGIGGMVGAGVFVTTGQATREHAGPAIVLSYAIAGVCALLSAFCYTEFAVNMPVAGGAFSYLRVTFGEFAAFLTGSNLMLEYVLSNAAVARSLTNYLAPAIGVTPSKLVITINGLPKDFNQIDLIAVGVVLIITILICYSIRESSLVNIILTTLHILFIIFIIVIGFSRGDIKNFTQPRNPNENPSGFFPFGAFGVFKGASIVYMSYIGYDAVSTLAEEVRDPVKDIPFGVSGSVIIVTVLYCLMAASMSMLLPYDMINVKNPFMAAFDGRSDGWVSNVIGVGATFGILTSLLVAMLGQSRYLCAIGRSSVVPSWFAKVHPKTSTPVNASAFLGILTAILALFANLEVLLELISIGTLFVFYMVANAVIYRRYVVIGITNPRPTLSFLCLFSIASIIFTLIWNFAPMGKPKGIFLGFSIVIVVATLEIFRRVVKEARKPEFWGVPYMPWIPCLSIFLNVFLMGSISGPGFIRFGAFSALVVIVYVFYSVHLSYDAERNEPLR
ncbi:hypothetical protein ACFE04_009729 [Oxalis oulophora]